MTEEERKRLAGQKVEPQSQQEQQNAGGQAVAPAQTSGTVQSAQSTLQQQEMNRPGAYQSKWKEQLDGIMDKILNREGFNYDVNADALYQQYKDRYMQQGKLAMQDTMGQAAALTGGYGNSYAQNAGQQAYEGYLQGLNDKVPELYSMAMEKYQMEGDDLNNKANLLGNKDALDYSRYQDELNQWNTDRSFAYGQEQDALARQDKLDAQDKALAQDQVQYLLSLGIKPNDDLLKRAGFDSQYTDTVWQRNQPQTGGSGGGGGGGSRSGYSEGELTLEEMLQNMQKAGASRAEMAEVLNAAVADGTVSKSESNDWAHEFGLTGTGANARYAAPKKRK